MKSDIDRKDEEKNTRGVGEEGNGQKTVKQHRYRAQAMGVTSNDFLWKKVEQIGYVTKFTMSYDTMFLLWKTPVLTRVTLSITLLL